jgi:hypothetical protein
LDQRTLLNGYLAIFTFAAIPEWITFAHRPWRRWVSPNKDGMEIFAMVDLDSDRRGAFHRLTANGSDVLVFVVRDCPLPPINTAVEGHSRRFNPTDRRSSDHSSGAARFLTGDTLMTPPCLLSTCRTVPNE